MGREQRHKTLRGQPTLRDMDIYDINGGPPLLDRYVKDAKNISAPVWKEYFDGFKQAGVGPDEGCLPLHVWQIWDAMVDYLKQCDLLHFVAAGGVMAHYVAMLPNRYTVLGCITEIHPRRR